MQSVAVFVALLAAASANSAYQYVLPQSVVPQYNSAVVTSQRLGNNFAYSVQTPGVQQVYTSGYPTVGATQVVAKNAVPYVSTVPASTYKTVSGLPVVSSPLAYNAYGYNNLGYSGLYNGVYNGVYNGYNGFNGVYPYGAYNGLGNVVVA